MVKIHDRPVIHKLGISQSQADDIYRQQAAAMDHGCKPIGQHGEPNRHDRIEPGRIEINPVDQVDGKLTDRYSHHQPYPHLPYKGQQEAPDGGIGMLNPFNQRYGQKHCHRVVAA
ncbi:hypothetical protein D3C75_901690 [compost metagenome]